MVTSEKRAQAKWAQPKAQSAAESPDAKSAITFTPKRRRGGVVASSPHSGEGEGCSYSEATYEAWTKEVLQQAVKKWVPKKQNDQVIEYVLAGPCPRCLHGDGISETVPAETTWDYVIAFEPGKAKPKAIKCRCSAKHDGQPDKMRGCGQWGYVDLSDGNTNAD